MKIKYTPCLLRKWSLLWKYLHRRQWFFALAAITTLIIMREYHNYPVNDYQRCDNFTVANELVEARLKDLLKTENQTGCVMPELDPYSEQALKFNKDNIPTITCSGVDWVSCYKTKCSVKQQIINQMKNIECIYKDIIYVRDDYYYFGNSSKVLGRDDYVLTNSDHVKVSCTGMDVNGFGLFKSHWSGNKAGFRDIETQLNEKSINVLILIFDSTSRNGFIRRMPKSYRTLTDQLQAVVFESHNIVGDGTIGALFPMLTGHNELELGDSRKKIANNKYVDVKPFLFHVLKEHGYRTALLEDAPEMGTFQLRNNGFEHKPADHYLRPFFMEESEEEGGYKRQKYCVGDQPGYRFLLNLTKQFFDLQGQKFCLTHLCEISHSDFDMITAADDDLVLFLEILRSGKRLEDTLLIVMGDHGARFTSIRDTYQGKVEERLPFLSIVLPDKLKSKKPNALMNLRTNKNILSTHYDIHATVLDALGLENHRNTYKVPGSGTERGLSFLEPIPIKRTCAAAGVMPHWCACDRWHNVTVAHPMYKKAAEALARFINNISDEKRSKCARRNLLAIEWVMSLSLSDQINDFMHEKANIKRFIGRPKEKTHVRPTSEYYQAKIVMDPGMSVFEGTMQYLVKDDSFAISERDISRVNTYGDEPICVSSTHIHLSKYCYCKNDLSTLFFVCLFVFLYFFFLLCTQSVRVW